MPSAENPADPPLRLSSLASHTTGVRNSRCLLQKWLQSCHTPRLTPLPLLREAT